jgi:choline dehydrogenase-like flavoprotein
LFHTKAASQLIGGECLHGAAVQSSDEIDAYVRRFVGTAMHRTSTCAMGLGHQAVVDAELRVQGLRRPAHRRCVRHVHIVSGTTNAPVIMIAEKAADLIRGMR